MPDRILINREEREVRVAFMEGQDLYELHTEKSEEQSIVNNIYRGRVQDVVPGLQAAFVDVGLSRNMFLHFMDIRPESLVLGERDQLAALRKASETVVPGRIERKGRRPRQDPHAPQAASPVKKGDEIIVQVLKDEIGGKAPRVTTNLSLAGRYLVMLPFPSQSGGVSRKISLGQDRTRLRKLLSDLRTDDFSFIIRTAGMEQPDEAIHKDAVQLQDTWETILKRYRQINGPGLVNNDHDLIARLVRDAFPAEFDEVICDNAEDLEEAKFQLEEVLPGTAAKVKLYDGLENIFDRYGVEKQIERALAKKYWLKSGGYLIVDENEALTAIDVNTGRFTGKKDQEKTSLKTNTEACEAIADLIRLRDLGGIIVIDFIDMLSRVHQERVSEELRRHLRRDRAKTAIGRIGDFGLMMLTRKRQRVSLLHQLNDECPYCTGSGYILRPEETFRKLKYEILKVVANDHNVGAILISGHQKLIDALQAQYHGFQAELLAEWQCDLSFRIDADLHIEDFVLTPVKRGERAGLRVTERVAEDKRVRQPAPEELVEVAPSRRRTATPSEPADGPATVLGRDKRKQRPPRERRDDRRNQQAPPPQAKVYDIEPEEAELFDAAMENIDRVDQPASAPTEGTLADNEPQKAARRRHRESSSERRARRRRAREMEGLTPDAADSAVSGEFEEVTSNEAPQVTGALNNHNATRSDSGDNDDEDFSSSDDDTAAAPADENGGRPERTGRTRRGSRGGRNRRKRGGSREEEQNARPSEQHVNVARVTPPSFPAEPLRLRKAKSDDPLGSFLDEIEQRLTTMKDQPATERSVEAEMPTPPSSRKRKLRAVRRTDEDERIIEPVDDDDDEAPAATPDLSSAGVAQKQSARKPRPQRRPEGAKAPPPAKAVEVAPPTPSRGTGKPKKKPAPRKPAAPVKKKKPARKAKETKE